MTNSVGGLVGLQAAVDQATQAQEGDKKRNELIKGVILIDISLRMLHESKQSPLQKPFVSLVQLILRSSALGESFFNQIAEPRAIKNILSQAYGGPVDDETVDLILKPGLQVGLS